LRGGRTQNRRYFVVCHARRVLALGVGALSPRAPSPGSTPGGTCTTRCPLAASEGPLLPRKFRGKLTGTLHPVFTGLRVGDL